MIVLKQSNKIVILKAFRIASFRLKSAKSILGEGTPHPQPLPLQSAALSTVAASPLAMIV